MKPFKEMKLIQNKHKKQMLLCMNDGIDFQKLHRSSPYPELSKNKSADGMITTLAIIITAYAGKFNSI